MVVVVHMRVVFDGGLLSFSFMELFPSTPWPLNSFFFLLVSLVVRHTHWSLLWPRSFLVDLLCHYRHLSSIPSQSKRNYCHYGAILRVRPGKRMWKGDKGYLAR